MTPNESIEAYHNKAMELADKKNFRLAASWEFKALTKMIQCGKDIEPSCSVLFRSAATLALEAKDYFQCEYLITAALHRQNIPDEIREELLELQTRLEKERYIDEDD